MGILEQKTGCVTYFTTSEARVRTALKENVRANSGIFVLGCFVGGYRVELRKENKPSREPAAVTVAVPRTELAAGRTPRDKREW